MCPRTNSCLDRVRTNKKLRAGKTLTLSPVELQSDFRIPLRREVMGKTDEAERSSRLSYQVILMGVVLVISIVATAWVLVTVGIESQIPSSDFVQLPTTPLSTKGNEMVFISVSAIYQESLAVGVEGSLRSSSGLPIAGAKVYLTYYLRGAYRTQVATTDQNGYFEVRFPMNWTGWLPLTLTYFGDEQHKGLRQVFSVSGENLQPQ